MYKRTDKAILGNNLKELRKSLGYTQQNVADILNIKRTAYAKTETGVTYGSIETLTKISGLFCVSMETLLGTENNTLHIKIHSNTITKFNTVCQKIGISSDTAIKMFVQAVINQQKIPFEPSTKEEK